MLRTLLKERFGLVERVERRLVDGYDLLVGGDGLRMREVASIDDLGRDFGGPSDVTETLDGPSRLMTIPLGTRRVTSRSLYSTWTAADRTFRVDAERISMTEFAELLAFNLDQPVVDRTGLDGVYAFSVVLDGSASVARVLRSLGVTSFDGRTVGDPTGVSTPKAVESLGLRLKPGPVPLDFVVVDKIERKPTEN
jgi:uncharacterized protein (TIGR03435 family)